ncbi:hypothetical protein FZW96_11175 [Bacillus sp. BGMRC 2118]|nr:hypothetical protein FZW96_11175 [Bacillus sp. BGMRC 2118]
MTAEIAILNRMGIALAADSAVTIGNNESQKVYNTANKLFALSKNHPIGIMIYGNATYMGVPWEIIIKSFRSHIGSEKYSELSSYCDSFFDFLINDGRFINNSAENERVQFAFTSFLLDILRKVNERLDSELETDKPDEKTVINYMIESFSAVLSSLKEYRFLEGFDSTFIEEFMERHRENILNVIHENIFLELPENTYNEILEIAAHMFSKGIFTETSGLVISGYGENEIFPSLYDFTIDGFYCGRLKYIKRDPTVISSADEEGKTTASIRPFAQKEMVYSFMEGIDPLLNDVISDCVEDIFYQLPELIEEKLGNKYTNDEKEVIRDLGISVVSEFNDILERVKANKFINPVVEVVQLLPKEELAAMAEALVNLTSFKRKITKETESVGGPIDVAVISKGDGLIWIKENITLIQI